eukprot:3190882-Pyramimonas_sp.AAC.1
MRLRLNTLLGYSVCGGDLLLERSSRGARGCGAVRLCRLGRSRPPRARHAHRGVERSLWRLRCLERVRRPCCCSCC